MAIRIGYATKALEDLYVLMHDGNISMRNRIMAAVSASRVEPLMQAGQPQPAAVIFLRNIVNYRHEGKAYRADWRRECATALAHWERRCTVAALKFKVADDDQRLAGWRRILNGCIRMQLHAEGRWPADKAVLLDETESFDMPPYEPELGLAALLIPGTRPKARQRDIDEPPALVIASETQRREILTAIATAITPRLKCL